LALAILADHCGHAKAPDKCPFCGSAVKDWKCEGEPEPGGCGYDGEREGDKWRNITSNEPGCVHYQNFKFDVLGYLDHFSWRLTGADVQAWVDKKLAGQAKEMAAEAARPVEEGGTL
jgi:hypothetical protein